MSNSNINSIQNQNLDINSISNENKDIFIKM